jgi:hypothetical protein
MSADPDLPTLDALHASATAPPWKADGIELSAPSEPTTPSLEQLAKNAQWIAAIHNAYPALSARIRELEAGLREAVELAADLRGYARDWDWKHGAEWDAEKARLELVLKGDAK